METVLTRAIPGSDNPLVDLAPTESCGVGLVASVDGESSRRILDLGLVSLANVAHRGAIGADGKTGDGAGVTTTIPRKLFSRWLAELDVLEDAELLGIGVLFLPSDPDDLEFAIQIVSKSITSRGMRVLGYRDVPVDHDQLGDEAKQNCPVKPHCVHQPFQVVTIGLHCHSAPIFWAGDFYHWGRCTTQLYPKYSLSD